MIRITAKTYWLAIAGLVCVRSGESRPYHWFAEHGAAQHTVGAYRMEIDSMGRVLFLKRRFK